MFDTRKSLNTVLLAVVSFVPVSTYAQPTTTQSDWIAPTAADTQQAVFLAGPGDVKPGTQGTLRITAENFYFESATVHASVPISQIISVSEGEERAEKGGAAGILGRVIKLTKCLWQRGRPQRESCARSCHSGWQSRERA